MIETDKLFCFLLAGGEGSRLKALTVDTCKPLIKIGSHYSLVDFPLLNCLYSDVFNIAIIVQYESIELIRYLVESNIHALANIYILPPETKFDNKENIIYQNTAHSVFLNKKIVSDEFEDIIILSADHVYSMNYNKFYEYHKNKNADLTIAYSDVPMEDANRFGILNLDADGNIESFEEKPENPKSNHSSMGVYIFKKKLLFDVLDELIEKIGYDLDFGRDIIPYCIENYNVNGYKFNSYWKDLGTVQSFWQTNMDIINHGDVILQYINAQHRFKISKESFNSIPPYFGGESKISSSIIGKKTFINGEITHSIIGNNTRVYKGAKIKNSVLMDNCVIEKGVAIEYAVISQNNTIEEDVIGDIDNIILI